MVEPVTNNYGFVLIATGDLVGQWGNGTPSLNNTIFSPLDQILGAVLPITINSSDVNLSNANWQSGQTILLTGTLTGNRNLILPLNNNSATVAVGGRFVVVNNTSGGFNVTVKTVASGSTGVTIPQGFAASLYSDGTNVGYANSGLAAYALASAGNPNGILAGTAASVNTNASIAYDYVSGILYICTTTGTSSTAVWTNIVAGNLPLPDPQGRLTPASGLPVVPSDINGSTTIYYTPYIGSWVPIHNGSKFVPYQFSQMLLNLTASQTAGNIYDVFLAYNAGVPVIGTGPAWSSAAAGSSTRGTGAGTTQIQRDPVTGLWVNSNAVSVVYSNGSISGTLSNVTAGQLLYLGSIFIDATNGNVSCLLSWGQNRKYGVWNAYNGVPIYMIGGDSTTSWTYNSATWRSSNNNSANKIQSFVGLAQTPISVEFSQNVSVQVGASVGIGLNITNNANGYVGIIGDQNASPILVGGQPRLIVPPGIGINNLNMLEFGNAAASQFFGTQPSMQMVVSYVG